MAATYSDCSGSPISARVARLGKEYFAAGINGETEGLFGSIGPVPEPGAAPAALLALAVATVLRRRRG